VLKTCQLPQRRAFEKTLSPASASSDLPNHTEPVQAEDLFDSLISVAQLLHGDGDLRIIADVCNLARQLRAAIEIRAQYIWSSGTSE
jgi:hypothetical protein